MTSSVNFVDSFPEGEAMNAAEIKPSPSGRVASESEAMRIQGRTDEIYFQ